MKTPFNIIFRSDIGPEQDQYMALDDIQFHDCGPASTNTCGDPKNKFTCDNNICVSNDRICDYNDDCGDGSDEKKCSAYNYKCDFEDGLCIWTPQKVLTQNWSLQTGLERPGLGPTFDHSKGICNVIMMKSRDNSINHLNRIEKWTLFIFICSESFNWR